MSCFCENPELLSNSSSSTKNKNQVSLRSKNRDLDPNVAKVWGVGLCPSPALSVPSAYMARAKEESKAAAMSEETWGPLIRGGGRGKMFLAAEAEEVGRKERGEAWGESTQCPISALLHAGGVRVGPPALPDPIPWLTVGTGSISTDQQDLQGNAKATESVKGIAGNLCMASTESVPLPPSVPCLGSCSQGSKNKRREKRGRLRENTSYSYAV